MMFYRRLLPLIGVLALALVLAACGGDDDDSNGEDMDNGDSVETPASAPEDDDNDRPDTITFTVTGDEVAAGTVEAWRWATQPTSGTVDDPDPNTFILLLYEEILNQNITFEGLPYALEPGEFAIVPPDEMEAGQVTASYIHDVNNAYSTDVSGTLTIEAASRTIQGRFNFDVTKDTDPDVRITVEGTFREVDMPSPPAD